jgi:acetyltransferase-like isoleucine patch superfamily enzyme
MNWRRLPARVEDKLAQIVHGALGRRRLLAAGVEMPGRSSILGRPIVARSEGSRIVVGDGVVLCSRSRWTALGVAHPVVLRTLRPGAVLSIGRGTGISGGSFCAALSLRIGERCLIGADVTIADTDFHSIDPALREAGWDAIACAPVEIGDDVFIGTRAVILKGVRIGDGAVVGAGAVVTRSLPAGAVAAGNPAVVLRQRSRAPGETAAAAARELSGVEPC